LKISYYLKKQVPLLATGWELGFDDFLLSNQDGRNQQKLAWLEEDRNEQDISVQECNTAVTLQGNDFCYVLSKRSGLFEQIRFAGKDYLDHPMQLNIWRAPTDNDMYIKKLWKDAHFDSAYSRAYQMEITQNEKGVSIKVADTVQKILEGTILWEIDGTGKIHADMLMEKDPEFPVLPRFGIRLFLEKGMEEVAYFGMGPQESYRDKHQGSYHGLFRAKVAELHEDYIRPQEKPF
jgi:beta-galactosidase